MRRLLDEQAIIATAIRYTWALDAKHWHALDDVFVADATARLGHPKPFEGREAIVAVCAAALTPLAGSQHLVGNHEVTVDGDEAAHRCYVQAQHVGSRESGGGLYVVAGRYEDRMERTADGWRIRNRDLIVMWTDGDEDVLGHTR